MNDTDQQTQDKLASTPVPLGGAGRWELDPERSAIGFRVRKMGLYKVKGRFRTATGELRIGDEGAPLSAQLTIDAASVTTRMPPRDLHLRSAHFLAAAEHPTIRVQADSFWHGEDGGLRAAAAVAVKDATKRLEVGAHSHDEPRAVALGVTPPPPFSAIVGREIELDAMLVFVR
jgi:polyisoprenoid-binding protein YceI